MRVFATALLALACLPAGRATAYNLDISSCYAQAGGHRVNRIAGARMRGIAPQEWGVPVPRLIANTNAEMAHVGRLPSLLRQQARLHYVAAFFGDGELVAVNPCGVGEERILGLDARPDAPVTDLSAAALVHLKASRELYAESLTGNPDDPAAWLGLASLLEDGAPYARMLGALPADATRTVDTAEALVASKLHALLQPGSRRATLRWLLQHPATERAVFASPRAQTLSHSDWKLHWLRQSRVAYANAASIWADQGAQFLVRDEERPGEPVRTISGMRFLEAVDSWRRLEKQTGRVPAELSAMARASAVARPVRKVFARARKWLYVDL